MVNIIPKDNELGLLIEIVKGKVELAEIREHDLVLKKNKDHYAGQAVAYRDILALLRSLLPEVEIS